VNYSKQYFLEGNLMIICHQGFDSTIIGIEPQFWFDIAESLIGSIRER
jgi:hypothetical protein